LLISCQQNGVDARILPTATKIVTVIPSLTDTPKPTITPSVTPFPTLSGVPPYLVLQPIYDNPTIYIYNYDGKGRKVVELPKGGWSRNFGGLNKLISPDGNWLVYYQGTVQGGGHSDNLPVSLNILNLQNGTTKKIVDVVTEGYQAKLDDLVNQLKETEPEYYEPVEGIDWVPVSIDGDFQWTIYTYAWSTDSMRLAFAGQIDGVSSDVYIYDLESETVKRVEDTLHNVQWITWSPDGEHLVFTDSHPGNIYTGSTLYSISAIDFNNQKPRQLISGTWLFIGDWLSSTKILAAQGTDTAGLFELQSIDITTGQITYLWDDGFSDFKVDYEKQTIILNASEYADPENFGIYEVSFNGEKRKMFDGLYWVSIFLRDGIKHRFLITGADHDGQISLSGNVVGITEGNDPTYFGKFDYLHVSISPDKSWLLMYDDEKIYLYDRNDDLKNTFLIPDIYSILWMPDSSGLVYSTGYSLYFLDINNGSITFIDQCLKEKCSFRLSDDDSMWLP
ncbi:MAG TPA: hypothetical protein PK078_00350, partial [Anaerolineales bacterium]|nr:hypothetical protein [Anaerolineales bacterium]HNA88002.1 hypothetical protein [Anaerolineales bacterium]